jgi:valyl-tRNA synthetase
LGADTAYSEEVLKIGNKLVNKLWNASKFASINLSKLKADAQITETLDKWIITRLNKTIRKATEEFEQFEYCRARVAIEDFFWNDFCDNYLEMAKTRSYDEAGVNPQGQQSALKAIQICIENILKLWAPFVPHITEELNSIIFGGESIHARGSWPKANLPEDETAEKIGIACVEVLEYVRKKKSENNVSVKHPVKRMTVTSYIKDAELDLMSVTSCQEIVWDDKYPVPEIELGEQKAA